MLLRPRQKRRIFLGGMPTVFPRHGLLGPRLPSCHVWCFHRCAPLSARSVRVSVANFRSSLADRQHKEGQQRRSDGTDSWACGCSADAPFVSLVTAVKCLGS